MIDERELLERAVRRFEPEPGLSDRVYRRRDRKRRNQRIAAGVVGLAVFVAAVWITTSGLSFDRTQTPVDQPAAEVDGGFRGWYRVIGHQVGEGCPIGERRNRVEVRYVGDRVRYLESRWQVWSGRLSYTAGERFPWRQTNNDDRWMVLRYDPATNSAVGIQYGLQECEWRVRLLPIGIIAAGQAAGAVDEGFQGWYRVIGREVGGCSWGEDFTDRVWVRYVDERVRRITHAGLVYNGGLMYTPGERFPWQSHQHGRSWELRYDPATDWAVGTRDGLETCLWRVRFVAIG